MKYLLILVVLSIGAYLLYSRPGADTPVAIENPVYAEIRMMMPIGSRKLDIVLFGKMASETECQDRAAETWRNMIDGCVLCTMEVSSCNAQLTSRNQRLFDNQAINTTYLSFTNGSRNERDGRMVFWGVTTEESNAICESARTEFKKRYAGQVECVAARVE